MAAELSVAILSPFIQVAFDKLVSHQTLPYFQKTGLNDTLVKKLKIILLSINSVIDDAEDKQFSDSNVKAWLCELKDAVYDAEDVLDEINYEVHRRKLEAEEAQTSVISKVRKFFNAFASSFDMEIESRMKQVLENLEFLEARKIDLGLKQGKDGAAGFVAKLPTTSLVDEVGIYGRNDDKEIVIKRLLNDSHFSVISIVGMGGLGKTTLAQLVYNDERIKSEFDLRVWVCVSNDFDVLRLTKIIFKRIMTSNDDIEDLDILQNKLKDELSDKKLLIVLDDVWCDDYISWEALRAPFICGVAGSRILVTSRNENVALAALTDEMYHPHQLSDEDGWLLFTKYALHNSCPRTDFDLEEVRTTIVKNCNGLPLALKTIGSLLYRSSWEEWSNILISEIWNMSFNNILPALILSYHHLPSHLKPCFAYCSLFPKDYEFDKEELVLLWMAQDFLQASQPNKSIEEVGSECFHELVSRSFFQKSAVNETRFVMHDILNDLANFVSGEFCFKQDVEEVTHISEKTRHLSFLTYKDREFRQLEYLQNIRKLRTFLHLSLRQSSQWTSSELVFDQLFKCKCLRVLSLASNFNIMELPDSIKNLIHLRYFNLSSCKIKRLPESICLLYNLQVLKLSNCRQLKELPIGLHKLKNLFHLDLQCTGVEKIPPNLGKLKNLQIRLTAFPVGKRSEFNIKRLGELNLQGKLSIFNLHNVVDGMDALKANLKGKKYLEELSFQWDINKHEDSHNERDVLEKLQPHQNLKKLSIKYYGGTRFPDWFVDNTLFNIVLLRLESCKYCFVLPSLGLLPSLKSLFIQKLDGIVTIGAEFLGGNSSVVSFRSLETLELAEMMNWEEWDCTTASRAFPLLKNVCIRKCAKLKKSLPGQLPSLENLHIEDCLQLVAFVPWAPIIHRLTLRNCEKVQLEPINNTCIEEVEIRDCPNLEFSLNQSLNLLRKIRIVRSCGSLRTFTLDLFPTLQRLSLEECNNLEMISVSEGLNHVPTSLVTLQIKGCPKFVSFSDGGYSNPKLEWCCFKNLENLKSLPQRMDIFAPSPCNLIITDCPQMESFPEGGLPSKLTKLSIIKCPKLFACRVGWGLHNYGFLRSLSISGDDVESLPEPGLLPTSLTSLGITECSNLKMLDYNALCQLPSLQRLSLTHCPKLQCLPKEGLPISLSFFQILGDCPVLKQRCQKLKGEDWAKIAHIPHVYIDNVRQI